MTLFAELEIWKCIFLYPVYQGSIRIKRTDVKRCFFSLQKKIHDLFRAVVVDLSNEFVYLLLK